jgi:hypothetical protein
MSHSTTAILASDFSDRTTDVLRDRWTLGKLRHVIKALAWAPVAITTEAQTGGTLIGARLLDAFDGGPSRGNRLTIQTELSDGTTQTTNYRADSLGLAIIPLADERTGMGPKWAALDSWREEKRAAIDLARAAHPDWSYGRFEATPAGDHVSVTFEAQSANGGPKRAHDRFDLAAVENAKAAR